MERRSAAWLGAVLVALAAASATLGQSAPAQNPANLQLALDKPVDLAISDATIVDVFAKLSAKTGIQFIVPEETLECLPYGDQTRLSVTLTSVTPRKALTEMLRSQALRWDIRDQDIVILPTDALSRLCRRAAYDELRLLGVMNSVSLAKPAEAGDPVEQLRKVSGNKNVELVFLADIDKDAALKQAEKALPGTAAEWLDMLCRGQGLTWYLEGSKINVVNSASQLKRQLQKQVSLRYQNADLAQVLRDLAGKARLKVNFDPGVMNLMPAETRSNFGLMMADASIEQALEVISGETGLQFSYTADGINVSASDRLKQGVDARGSRPRSPFYLRLTLKSPEGSTIEMLVPAEQLPEKLQQALQDEKSKLLEDLSRKYGVEPPMP